MQEQKKQSISKKPQTYFDLIQKVGTSGKYQFILMLIFSLNWYVTGIILLSTAFLFLNKQFDCQSVGLLTKDCRSTVCNLPQSQWAKYIDQNDNFISVASSFGQYYCDNQVYLDLASTATYFGAFLGYVLFSFFSDNFGRRKSMILAWSVATIGTIILAVSQNLPMVAVGLFFAGSGSDAAINICFYFFSEVVEDNKRQKYSVIVQIAFCFGAIAVTILYYFIPNWRIVTIATVTTPAVIALALIIFYAEQTPQFLLRISKQATLKALNRIGKINFGKTDLLKIEDVQNVMQEQVQQKQFQQVITPLDLIRFPSLRQVTICSSIISFCIYVMYYGPILIISSIGFNIYISNIILQCSELITYIPSYLFIEKIPRQKSGILLMTIAGIASGILIFVVKPADCQLCSQSFIELGIISVFRFCISLYFVIFLVYFVQLYPSRARGLGVGIVSAVGTIASTISPIFLGILQRNNLNVMIIFTIIAIIAVGTLTLLQQTQGVQLKQQIQEIAMEKNKRKTLLKSKKDPNSMISSQVFRENKKKSENNQSIKD